MCSHLWPCVCLSFAFSFTQMATFSHGHEPLLGCFVVALHWLNHAIMCLSNALGDSKIDREAENGTSRKLLVNSRKIQLHILKTNFYDCKTTTGKAQQNKL